MKKILLMFVFSILTMISCNKDEESTENTNKVFGFSSIEEARQYLGVYADIFENTHGSVYVRTTKYNDGEIEQGEIFGRYSDNDGNYIDGGKYIFDDIELVFDNTLGDYFPKEGQLTIDEINFKISNFFGKENNFELIQNGQSVIQSKQYVPEKITVEILNALTLTNTNSSGIQRGNIELNWNSDAENENGIVVYLWWNGSQVGVYPNEQVPVEAVNRAIKLDDTGQGTIPASFFDGIPNNASLTLFIMRGNTNILTYDNQSFKFYSVAQHKKNVVLKD